MASEHYLILLAAAGCVALTAGFVGAWIGARFAARGAARAVLVETEAQRMNGDRAELRQLTESIEAMSIEVERVAEAQRFIARVLVERPDPKLSTVVRRELGKITPH